MSFWNYTLCLLGMEDKEDNEEDDEYGGRVDLNNY
jgi:hypothetical protein